MDRPWIRSRAGDTEAPAQISAIARIAVTSRVVRPRFKGRDPAMLFEAYQAPDDWCRAGLGLRIDAEHDVRIPKLGNVDPSGSQCPVGACEIVEFALQLVSIELDLLPLARYVETLDEKSAAALGFNQRRCSVKRELGPDRRRSTLSDAAQDRGRNLAGLPGRRVCLARIAFRLFALNVGKVHNAFFGPDDHGADAADPFAPAGIHVADD